MIEGRYVSKVNIRLYMLYMLALVDELNEEQPWPDGEDHTYWLWFATMLCSLNSLVTELSGTSKVLQIKMGI